MGTAQAPLPCPRRVVEGITLSSLSRAHSLSAPSPDLRQLSSALMNGNRAGKPPTGYGQGVNPTWRSLPGRANQADDMLLRLDQIEQC
ncbi:hypothetical protein AAFF_G00078650 [Aldrovandia affinis]|uniref:Uncharacterized protein n=1 Tax=Aldrovandia affinis TaxID=143900 RepID=A0AAD7RXF7_9TELE|nr:hypothetical protein AAFF_G00078650 [Aldrovandia affinis]